MININIMPGCFFRYGVSSFIRINSMIGQKNDIGFVEQHHFRWQEENSLLIDQAMGVETPAKAGNGSTA
jgi:hypothetical protein